MGLNLFYFIWNSNLERTLQVIYPLRNWKSRVRMFSSIICNVAHIENDIWFFEHLLTPPAQRKYFDPFKSDLIFVFSNLIALKSRQEKLRLKKISAVLNYIAESIFSKIFYILGLQIIYFVHYTYVLVNIYFLRNKLYGT